MHKINELSQPAGLDSSLIKDLNSAIVAIQKAVDQIQPLDTPADNVIILTDTVADPPDVTGVSASALSSGNATGTSQKWYAVLVGRQPGVFYGPNNITSNTTRIPGANPIRCDTEEEAKCVFDAALDAGMVEMADVVITRAKMTQNEFPVNTYRLTQ